MTEVLYQQRHEAIESIVKLLNEMATKADATEDQINNLIDLAVDAKVEKEILVLFLPVFIRVKKEAGDSHQHVEALRQTVVQIEKRMESILQPPAHVGTLVTIQNGTGPERARVRVGAQILELGIDTQLPREQLLPGHEVLVNNDFTAVIGERGICRDGGRLMELSEVIDGQRLIVKNGLEGERMVVYQAATLDRASLAPGDTLRVNDALFAYEKIEFEAREFGAGFEVEKPDTTFDDIGGLSRVKKRIVRQIILPKKKPQAAVKWHQDTPKHVMLHGPSGTGKTLLAKGTANLHKSASHGAAHFFSIAGSEFLSPWLGDAERQIRELYQAAVAAAAEGHLAIIFIDECESIFRSRSGAAHGAAFANTSIVGQWLSLLDGFKEAPQVMVIAATNRVDLIDPAILRRFKGGVIEVPPPNRVDAREILGIHLETPWFADPADRTESIEQALDFVYSNEQVAAIAFRDGGTRQPIFRHTLVHGGLLAEACAQAARCAFERELDMEENAYICADELLGALAEEVAAVLQRLTPNNVREYVKIPRHKEVLDIHLDITG